MNVSRIRYRYGNIHLVIFLLILFSACADNSQKNSEIKQLKMIENGKYPKFEFTKEIHKFGVISEGEIGVCDFYFKNTGESNLIIKNIESSCGCADFKWKRDPIKVGEKSKITIQFNSKGRYGKQYKVITIYSNTLQKTKKLYISADVK